MTATDTKLVSKDDIPSGVGVPGVQETKRWFKQQVVYKNYAGFNDALDGQILNFVNTTRNSFRNRMMGPHQRWAFNWATANGEAQTQEREDDVSMPETLKMLNAKVARMEEALFEIEPIFEVEGTRDDLGQLKALVIGAYLRRMLELASHRDYFGPAAKDAQLCNYSAIKVSWDKRFADYVERKSEFRYGEKGQKPYWHDERWMARGLVEDCAKLELVDPFWLILDLDAGNNRDMSFIGDESEPFLHTLEEKAELGLYPMEQVKKIRDRKTAASQAGRDPMTTGDLTDQYRQARQIAMPSGMSQSESTENSDQGAARGRAIELWAFYNFGKGYPGVVDPLGRKITGTHKVVITVCNGIVLQFRLNPFDKKFHPYAVAVMNRNGHEMVAPAPFDQVVVMNAQYDRFASNVLRHLDLSIAPFLVTDDTSDMSEPLHNLVPGTIMKNPGNVKEIAIKDLPQSVQFFYSHYRREMEELSGALRVYEHPQGTATEVERKLQEQQRTVRSEIRTQSEQWRQVVLIIYKMAAQFSTQGQQFAVVGKASARLGKAFSVPPSWLQEEIDIKFLGIDSLHTLGARSAGITQWMNQWGPLLQTMPEVSLPALAQIQWEYMVGKHNMQAVFPNPEPPWMVWTQEEENQILRIGQRVPTSKHDNHAEHLAKVQALIVELLAMDNCPDFVMNVALDHMQDHLDEKQKQDALMAAQKQQADNRGDLLAPAGGMPGVDQPPMGGGMEAKTKQSGATPGPTQARTVARGGRNGAGVSQTQQADSQ